MCLTLTFICSIISKVNLSERGGLKEARLNEIESELARSHAACTRLSQVVSMLCFIVVVFQLDVSMNESNLNPMKGVSVFI